MSELIKWYKELIVKLILIAEKNKKYAPLLGKAFILYLKLPFLIKLIVNILISIISGALFYNIGFVILQSKARNEVLSVITAYHNSIEFPVILNYLYTFIFLVLFAFSIITIVVLYIAEKIIYFKINPVLKGNSFLKKLQLILIIIFLLVFWYYFILVNLNNLVTQIPYIMLYESKNSGVFESLLNDYRNHTNFSKEMKVLSVEYFANQIFISVQLANILISGLVFLIYLVNKYLKKVKFYFINTLLKNGLIIICSLSILLIVITHTFYQWGSFGKNLAQFNFDYVSLEYVVNGKTSMIDGVVIYRGDNLVILRDSCNVIHSIKTDQYHLKSVLSLSGCQNK